MCFHRSVYLEGFAAGKLGNASHLNPYKRVALEHDESIMWEYASDYASGWVRGNAERERAQ